MNEFRLDVPFFVQNEDVKCGPTNLRIALAFFGQEHTPESLKNLTRQIPSGLTFCQGVAVAASRLGFHAEYYSAKIGVPNDAYGHLGSMITTDDVRTFHELEREMRELGVPSEERPLSIEELLQHVSKQSIPLVVCNWNIVVGRPTGFGGHYATVVGYNDDTIIVHNTGGGIPRAYFHIDRKRFERAWSDQGADRNTIVIAQRNQVSCDAHE